MVHLLRRVLTSEALSLVDVELLLGLGAGLTAWLPAAVALQQALYDFLLVVETVGWVTAGWLDLVQDFPARSEASPTAPAPKAVPATAAGAAPDAHTISLYPDAIGRKEHAAMNGARESMLPHFSISDQTKGEITWLAQEARVPLDRAVHILVEIYRLQMANQNDFWDLETIVQLREACEVTEVAVSDLRDALELFAGLRRRGLTLDDLRTTGQVADDLAAAGLGLEDAVAVSDLMKALKKAGTDARVPERLETALTRFAALGYEPKRLGRLAELWDRLKAQRVSLGELDDLVTQIGHVRAAGLDMPSAAALATALELAAVPTAQRPQLLAAVVEKGLVHIELADLRAERDALREELQQLRAQRVAHDARPDGHTDGGVRGGP